MSQTKKAKFIDRSGAQPRQPELWSPLIVPKMDLEAEIARLAALPAPANGRRCSLIVHPQSIEQGPGLAAGVQVSLNVLLPGEKTAPIRHNSTQVNFCIRGSGYAVVGGKRTQFDRYDVWNIPSMATYRHANDGDEIQVRLVYSNAALLEKMNVHIVEEDLPVAREVASEAGHEAAVNPFGTFRLTDDGAYLMPYEKLINPDAVASKPLHWPWKLVRQHLDKLQALGKQYKGRRLYLLYNPATGRTNGTTANFFATITVRPPNIIDRPHRHTAAAINYYFGGKGYSVVEGKRYEWEAGDLMLSAPGWAIHNHASYDEPVYELTIQDSPLNIAMESLLWQENLDQPLAVLGAETGFGTNRGQLGVA